MKKQTKEIFSKVTATYQNLTIREKNTVLAALLVFCLMGLYQIYDSAQEKFLTQTIRLEEANTALRSLPPLIVKYNRSKTRRDEIEAKYKAVEIPEGALSLLEKLTKEKAKVPAGKFSITSKSGAFGTQYKQTTHTIKFPSSQISDVINFLKEVVDGSRPLLLTRLDITKSYAGDRLDIEVDISSIEKISAKDDA